MRKNLFLLLCLSLFSFSSFAQTVVTNPAIIQDGYTGDVVITYDPQGGDMASATKAFVHIGVLTSASGNDGDWKCAPTTWRGGEDKYKMAKNGNVWTINIGNMYDYFSACASQTFTAIMIVFNDGPGGTKEGKNAEGKDFKLDVVAQGLAVVFDGASSNGMVEAGEEVSFVANATEAAELEIKKNGVSVATASAATTIEFSETLSAAGDYTYEVYGNGELFDTRKVAVVSESESAPMPEGITDGVNYGDDNTKATLCIYVKDNANVLPDNVFVVGEFNDWSVSNTYQMKKDGTSGYWWLDIEGLTAGKEYGYQYWVKMGSKIIKISDPYSVKLLHPDDKWEPKDADPTLKDYPSGQDGYVSVLQTDKPEFNWSDETLNFVQAKNENLVVYEMWVRDFSPEQTYKGVTKRLDYLENLGVNAIELMPITEFDGNYSWGYNPNHYFAPDKAYGSEEDLKELIDECHKRGIAVIIDMVFNHATGLAPQLKLYWGADNKAAANNPWFNRTIPSSDHGGHVFDDWNHESAQTQEMFRRSLEFWIDEYKIDGYRMDLAQGFCGPQCSKDRRTNIMFNYYNNGVKAADPNGYFILEHWPDNDQGERQNYINNGMMCWSYNNLAINKAFAQTAMGWLKDGDSFKHTGITDGWVSYAESHDEERNFWKATQWGNGSLKDNLATRMQRVPLNNAFILLQNGPKMMWQFQELGFDYSIGANDKGVVPTKPNGDFNFEQYRTSSKPNPEWKGWLQNADRMKSYQVVSQIVQLRTRIAPEIFEGNPTNVDLTGGKKVRSITWGSGNQTIFVVGNFNTVDGETWVGNETITLPAGNNWYDYLANAETTQAAGSTVSLAPGEVKIYTATRYELPVVPDSYDFGPVSVPETDEDNEEDVYCVVSPTIVDNYTQITTDEQIEGAYLVAFSGSTFNVEVDATNKVDLTGFSQGMYLLVVKLDNTEKVFKLIKK